MLNHLMKMAVFYFVQQRAAIFPKKEKQARRSFSWKMLYRVAAVLLVLLVPFATYYQGKHTVKQNFSGYSGGSFIGYTYKIKFA